MRIRILSLGGNDIAIVYEDGHWEKYTLDESANYIPPAGVFNHLEYTYDDSTREGKYTLTFPDKSYYTFDEAGLLTAKFDTNGNETRFTYDGQLLSQVSTDSGSLSFTYDGELVNGITDSAGRSVSYAYTDGNLTSFTDPDGNVYTVRYGRRE